MMSFFLCYSSPPEISRVSDEHRDECTYLRRDHPGSHERLLFHLLAQSPERQECSRPQRVRGPQPRLQLSAGSQSTTRPCTADGAGGGDRYTFSLLKGDEVVNRSFKGL